MMNGFEINRDMLVSAVRESIDELPRHPHDNNGLPEIIAGGLIFLLTGEDGDYVNDDVIHVWGNNPDKLHQSLVDDITSIYPMLNPDEMKQAQDATSLIVSAVVNTYGNMAN